METEEAIELIKVQKILESARLPKRKNGDDVGYDIFLAEDFVINPGEVKIARSGIAIELPSDYGAHIRSRSSIFKRGCIVQGEIDTGYRGEIGIMIANIGCHRQIFKEGDRIAQMILFSRKDCVFMFVDELSETCRGKDGFGSTGS